jgi:hypothetical protein
MHASKKAAEQVAVPMSDNAQAHSRNHAIGLPRVICVRRGELWVAGVLAAVGALFFWQASLLDLGNFGLPGPGFFPLVLSAIIVVLCAVIGIERWRAPANGESVELGHRDVLITFVFVLVVPLIFERVGAYVALGLFGASLLVLVARTPPALAAAAAVVGMVACWYFFQILLALPLPRGPF